MPSQLMKSFNRCVKAGVLAVGVATAGALVFGAGSDAAAAGQDSNATVTKMKSCPDLFPAGSQTATAEKEAIRKDIAKCYEYAIFYGRERDIKVLEAQFDKLGFTAAEREKIRNDAFFNLLDILPFKGKIELAVKYGADIHVKDKEGRGIEHYLMFDDKGRFGTSWSDFREFIALQKKYELDTSIIFENAERVLGLLISPALPQKQDELIEALEFLKEIGFDFSYLQEQKTGFNLMYMARHSGAEKLETYLSGNKELFGSYQEISWDFQSYHDFLEGLRMPLVPMPEEFFKPEDYNSYTPLVYDRNRFADNGVDPTLIVAEYIPNSVGDKIAEILGKKRHIQNTGLVAYGVGRTLKGPDTGQSLNLAIIERNAGIYNENPLTLLTRYSRGDYLIVSSSTGEKMPDNVSDVYRKGYGDFFEKNLRNMDKRNMILYKSAGNDGDDKCLTVDGVDFCMQDSSVDDHPLRTVRVGAAHINDEGGLIVEDYSQERPTYCALLPYDSGELFAGTSFSAPAAAAVERQLADIFARSKAFPNGVIHEDIVMALMLTAQSDGLIDEATGKSVPVYRNSAGLKMTDRCGAGVIRPQAAADLLAQMVDITTDNADVARTEMRKIAPEFDVSHYTQRDGRYEYDLTVPENGILVSVRAALEFEDDSNRGAALIQVGDEKPFPLDLTKSGLTTEFRLAGHRFKAGDQIKFITTKPLLDPTHDFQARSFVDLRMVNSDSPVATVINSLTLTQ